MTRRAAGFAAQSLVLPALLDWRDLMAGRSAVTFLDEAFPVRVGAAVPSRFDAPPDWPFSLWPRALGLALEAVRKLKFEPGRRYGLILGMANLFSETAYLEHTLPHRGDPAAMARVLGFSFEYGLDYLAECIGAGPRLRVDSACATGNDALIAARQWLLSGVVDDVIVVAASAMLNPVGLALFNNIRALNGRADLEASCPFDLRRRGFVMGEGAAAVWLTSDETVPVEAYLCGHGQSMNAEKFVEPPQNLEPMLDACRAALGKHDTVAYVSAHGTATPSNDLAETRLHRALFGSRAETIPLSSIKSMIGHCLAAAALIEAIVCVKALQTQTAPPTINLHHPDPECDLDYIPQRAGPIRGNFALSNAFAFGGQNSAILIAKEPP